MKTYNEEYPQALSEGIGLISSLSQNSRIPWASDNNVVPSVLEQLYAARAGFKTITPSFLFADGETRVKMLATLFADKWTRLWNDFKLEYNQLDAYRVDETVTRDRDDSDESTNTFGKVIDSEHTDSGSIDTNTVTTDTADGSVYGFNSVTNVPSDKTTNIGNENVIETRDLETTDKTTNSGSDNRTSSHTEDETTTTSRTGNIGYTTPQELLRQDIELWHTPFFNLVFDDIDNFIMLQVYSI